MGAAAKAIIRITAVPDRDLKRVMNGTKKAAIESQKGIEKAQIASAKKIEAAQKSALKHKQSLEKIAARESIRQARDVERARIRSEEKASRVAERARAKARKDAERTARAEIKAAEMAARGRVKAAEKARKEQQRQRRGIAAGAAGAAYGGLKAAAQVTERGQRLAQVGTVDERLQTAGELKHMLIRKGGEAGMDKAGIAEMEQAVLAAATASNIAPLDIGQGLVDAQTRFDKLQAMLKILPEIAQAAQAAGDPVQDLMNAVGTMSTVHAKDDKDSLLGFLDSIISRSHRGSIAIGEIGGSVAKSLGDVQGVFKRKDAQFGVNESMAMMQTLGTAQAGAEATGTRARAIALSLSSPLVQKKLHKIKASPVVGDKRTGNEIKPLADIIESLANNKKFASNAVSAGIFQNVRALYGIRTLVDREREAPGSFRALQDTAAGAGHAKTKENLDAIMGSSHGQLQSVGIKAQVDTYNDADRLIEGLTPAVERMTELQTQFPILTEALGALETTVKWAVGALIANKLTGGGLLSSGGKAAGMLSGGAGVSLGAGATGAVGGGIVATVASMAGAALAGGLAGVGLVIGSGLDKDAERIGAGLAGPATPRTGRALGRLTDPNGAGAKWAADSARLTGEAVADAMGRKKPKVTMAIEIRDGMPPRVSTGGNDGFDFIVDTGSMSEAP